MLMATASSAIADRRRLGRALAKPNTMIKVHYSQALINSISSLLPQSGE